MAITWLISAIFNSLTSSDSRPSWSHAAGALPVARPSQNRCAALPLPCREVARPRRAAGRVPFRTPLNKKAFPPARPMGRLLIRFQDQSAILAIGLRGDLVGQSSKLMVTSRDSPALSEIVSSRTNWLAVTLDDGANGVGGPLGSRPAAWSSRTREPRRSPSSRGRPGTTWRRPARGRSAWCGLGGGSGLHARPRGEVEVGRLDRQPTAPCLVSVTVWPSRTNSARTS